MTAAYDFRNITEKKSPTLVRGKPRVLLSACCILQRLATPPHSPARSLGEHLDLREINSKRSLDNLWVH